MSATFLPIEHAQLHHVILTQTREIRTSLTEKRHFSLPFERRRVYFEKPQQIIEKAQDIILQNFDNLI